MNKYNLIIIALPFLLSSCFSKTDDSKSAAQKATNEQQHAAKYTLATVDQGGVASTIKLPAQLAAYQEVSIFPKVNGYVKTVLVDIGSKVTKGSLLMVLEAPELEQAVLQAKEKYARSRADFLVDKERYNRLLEASKTEGAVSPMDLSTVKAKMASDSAVCNSEKANWEMQQTMISYMKITAPFTGVITERNVSPGELVSAAAKDKPMLELKEIQQLRLQVDVPEALASSLQIGNKVSFFVSAEKGTEMTGSISRKSENINAQYRTERVEVDVNNKNDALSSGMYADVLIHSNGSTNAMYVPKTAVVTSTERKYVLVVRNGKAVKVDVSVGNEDASKIEIYGSLKSGEKIIANASEDIKENTLVNRS